MPSWTAAVAEPFAEFVLAGYRMCANLVRPVVPLVLSARVARGKEDPARTGERYGRPSLKRPEGRLIWVHAASVGETNAVLPLVERLTAAGFPVLFTSTTITSAKIAAARLPKDAVHQFGPLDVPAYLDRFLDHWRPYFVIFVESEIWPNVIGRLEQAVVPLVIVNGRMSDRSFRRWQSLGAVARTVLSQVGVVLARSEEDGRRFRALGAPRVEMTGNLKFDTPPLPADPVALARLKAAIDGRPVWLAAQTHEGEEQIVAAAHALLRERWPEILTIIVPRHPARGQAIHDLLAAAGLSVTQRSRGDLPEAGAGIYVADTLDELGLFYRVAPVALVAGSLVARGGHNPIEPVRLGAAVLHGPHVFNFADLYALIDRAAPTPPITDAASLAAAVGNLLADATAAPALAAKAGDALLPLSGALDATMSALKPYLSGKYYSP
jgi:3-deoxy-D-manno-octulosonic-acid transferase